MKKLALVLGGGACKGCAHIGVLQVLEQYDIKPDLIIGVSMGAIIGGAYASGRTSNHLTNIARNLTKSKISDFNIFSTLFSTGVMRGKKIKKILYNELGDITHEQLGIPFVAIATDVLEGSLQLLDEGDVVNNMLASSAVPGVFPLVTRGGKVLCDGGILNNVPDDVARKLAKDYVVLSIDVIADYTKQVANNRIKVLGMMINAITLMQTKIMELKGNDSDLRVSVSQPDIGLMSFDKHSVEKSIEYGKQAMMKNINKLKKLLQD